MKKLFLIFFTAILLFGLVTSCELLSPGDDAVINSFSYDGVDHTIELANLENFQSASSPYNYALYLIGPGLVFDYDTANFSGAGDVIILDLYSSSTDGLAAGTYTWSTDGDAAGTIASAEMYLNYNTVDDSFDTNIIAAGGSVTVSKSGAIYTINFMMNNDTDVEIMSGSYEGELQIWID